MFSLKNNSKSIAKASMLLFVFGIIAKIIGLFREIIYANNFGLSKEYDIFLTVAAIPIVINSMILYLSQHYFIPAYNKLIQEENTIGNNLTKSDFFNYSFWWFTIFGLIISILLYFSANLILNIFINFESNEVSDKGLLIFYLLLITIPLSAGISVISAYLQANFNFVLPVIAQLVLNMVMILLTIFFTQLLGIIVLPVSFILAYLISFLVLVGFVYPQLKFSASLIFKSQFRKNDYNVFITLFFAEILSLSYVITDRYFIGQVPEGGIAALNYAMMIYLLPFTIFSLPLINVIFSRFSEDVNKTLESLRSSFIDSSRINIFVMIPVIIVMVFWGDVFLKILYERGKFDSSDTQMTFNALQYYCMSLIFFSNYLISVKLLYSLSKYQKVLIFSIAALAVKILLNIILVDEFKQNGLALATSLIYLLLFTIGYYFTNRLLKIRSKYFHFTAIVYFLFNGLISYILTNQLLKIINVNPFLEKFSGIIIFIAVYTANSFLLSDSEFKIIKEALFNFKPCRKNSDDAIIINKEY